MKLIVSIFINFYQLFHVYMHKALIKKKYSTIKPLDQVTEMNIPRATENSTCSDCHASSLFKTLFFH